MPSALELAAMRDFMAARRVVPPLAGACGAGLPLITYWAPAGPEAWLGERAALEGRGGAHLAALMLALRRGVPLEAIPDRLINLNPLAFAPESPVNDYGRLVAGGWQAGWNGDWSHAGGGWLGDGRAFYETYARYILTAPGFRMGLIQNEGAARRPVTLNSAAAGGVGPERTSTTVTVSPIERMALCAAHDTGRAARLYGCRGRSFVPLLGYCAGLACLGLDVMLRHLRLTSPGAGAEAPFIRFYAALDDALERASGGKEGRAADGIGGDRLQSGLRRAFARAAAFDPARARPLEQGNPALPADADPNWYVAGV